jgi:hypothetical protein
MWNRLADECKRRLIAMVQANLPPRGNEDEFDEFDEGGE